MYESKLEIDASGRRYLICWYDNERCDWDEVIETAMARHKLTVRDGLSVLCMPKRKDRCR